MSKKKMITLTLNIYQSNDNEHFFIKVAKRVIFYNI